MIGVVFTPKKQRQWLREKQQKLKTFTITTKVHENVEKSKDEKRLIGTFERGTLHWTDGVVKAAQTCRW